MLSYPSTRLQISVDEISQVILTRIFQSLGEETGMIVFKIAALPPPSQVITSSGASKLGAGSLLDPQGPVSISTLVPATKLSGAVSPNRTRP